MRKIEQTEEGELAKIWYKTAVRTAVVAGGFILIICILLVINYFQLKASDPLNSGEIIELKAKISKEPENDSLKEQIRTVDLRLRKEHFRHKEFLRKGSYLLLGGVVVFLISVKFAADYQKKLPMPQKETDSSEQRTRIATLSRWSVAGLGLIVIVVAVSFVIIIENSSTGKFMRAMENIKSPSSAKAEYPSQEEIKKNWHRFRGPAGVGISAYTNVPSSWNGETGEGILWKTEVPLPGENSPVVWEDRVFLTGATEIEREVYCFDANSGKILWQRPVDNVPGSPLEAPEVSEGTGFAAPTPVTDGQRICALFANGDIVCFDFDGNRVWAKNLGLPENMYGYASSLAMYQNLVLVKYDQGTSGEDGLSKLIALDVLSGRTVWQTNRPVPNSWSSPIVIDTGKRTDETGTGEQIITCANPWVIAYEPSTGKELWRAECLGGDVAPSPVYAGGLVFAVNAYSHLAAIRPDGQGNVTETHIVWTAEYDLPDICSPLSNGELIFIVTTDGFMTCYDAQTGSKVWEHDFMSSFHSSPSLVGDNVYLMSQEGVMFVFAADREYKELGKAKLGESSNTCPAFMDGRIYIRGKKNLYCIGSN